MADRIDRRCFLAKGVLGAAAVGAVHASIEEKTLAGRDPGRDGSGECRPDKPKTDIPPGSLPCGKIGNVSAQPAVHRRQPDRRLGPQPRPDVRLEAVHVLQHRGQGLRDAGTGPSLRHQHDPAGPGLLGPDHEIQRAAHAPRSRRWSASR